MIDILEYGIDDMSKVFGRSQLTDKGLKASVEGIVDDVAARGDDALFEYIAKYDKVTLDSSSLTVTEEEIDKAYSQVSDELLASLRRAKANILEYHAKQAEKYANEFYLREGNKLGWVYRAMDKVGLYVPGGKASYPSSILMCALPAVAAGVREIAIATPNPSNPLTLVAARECGVKTIYKMGGAHAIAALAYGTDSVEKVDLIAGPGNIFVTLAKRAVYGHVAIDMIAGPSEILIIADGTAVPEYLAADLLSQAEHDEMAASILIATDRKIAEKTKAALIEQLSKMPREKIAREAISNNSAIICVKSIDDAIDICNRIAPEHLEICVEGAHDVAMRIKNAGAMFIGNYSPEPLGDYFAGASHCLPTSGSARYFSVLNVATFMKKISYISYTEEGLYKAKDDIIAIAECEGLSGHANTIRVRFDESKG